MGSTGACGNINDRCWRWHCRGRGNLPPSINDEERALSPSPLGTLKCWGPFAARLLLDLSFNQPTSSPFFELFPLLWYNTYLVGPLGPVVAREVLFVSGYRQEILHAHKTPSGTGPAPSAAKVLSSFSAEHPFLGLRTKGGGPGRWGRDMFFLSLHFRAQLFWWWVGRRSPSIHQKFLA